jgi:hypothetical protein
MNRRGFLGGLLAFPIVAKALSLRRPVPETALPLRAEGQDLWGLGAMARTNDGNEYKYVKFVKDVWTGYLVHYSASFNARPLKSFHVGQIGVATQSFQAGQYGWLLVYGETNVRADTRLLRYPYIDRGTSFGLFA